MDTPIRAVRVYLVEDSPIMLRLLRELLSAIGIQIVGTSGRAAIAVADIVKLSPDVVVVDIALESGTGFDVLRTIARKKLASRPLCIMLTNHTHERFREAAATLGVSYFFDKSEDILHMMKVFADLQAGIPQQGNGTEH
ncbi:MAG: response regulator [Betaproteobacteria bacterium]